MTLCRDHECKECGASGLTMQQKRQHMHFAAEQKSRITSLHSVINRFADYPILHHAPNLLTTLNRFVTNTVNAVGTVSVIYERGLANQVSAQINTAIQHINLLDTVLNNLSTMITVPSLPPPPPAGGAGLALSQIEVIDDDEDEGDVE
jgi:hypothetical protein